ARHGPGRHPRVREAVLPAARQGRPRHRRPRQRRRQRVADGAQPPAARAADVHVRPHDRLPAVPAGTVPRPPRVPAERDVGERRLKVRVNGRHPWFYRKMIQKPDPPVAAGSVAVVRDREGSLVGTGFYNPRAELALRMFSGDAVKDVPAHFAEALRQAALLREEALALQRYTDAYRLVHAEGDGFPGLVLDKLGDALVAQVASLGMLQQLEPLG